MNEYHIGTRVEVIARFAQLDGTPVNPTTVTFKFEDPAHNETALNFGESDDVTNPEVGEFHGFFTVDQPGHWYYRFESTGNVMIAYEDKIKVRNTVF